MARAPGRRERAPARGRRCVLLVLSILLADPAACTPFVAARAQPAERRKVGLVAAHALGQHTPLTPSIPTLIVATLFETMLHRAVCSNPCGTGAVLMMTPASAAIDDALEDGATRPADVSMGRLVVQMAQSYFRGLATLVRLLLRQPDVPQALILLTVLGYAAQLVIGPSLARSGARLTSQVRSSLGCLPSPSPPLPSPPSLPARLPAPRPLHRTAALTVVCCAHAPCAGAHTRCGGARCTDSSRRSSYTPTRCTCTSASSACPASRRPPRPCTAARSAYCCSY